jgi:hypothetical protein
MFVQQLCTLAIESLVMFSKDLFQTAIISARHGGVRKFKCGQTATAYQFE